MSDTAADGSWSIGTTERAGATVVVVAGDLDYAAEPPFQDAVAEALHRLGDRPVVLDLTGVTFLGSAGLTALVNSWAAVEHRPAGAGPLRVVVDETRPVIRPMQISGLDQVLRLYHDVEGALADRP